MNSPSNGPILFLLTRHPLSVVGTALVTTAKMSWLFVLPLHIHGHIDNPYIGNIVFLILPVILFTGLAPDISTCAGCNTANNDWESATPKRWTSGHGCHELSAERQPYA